MGIHIAASKCPHVHAAVCESVPAAQAGHHRQQLQRAGHGRFLRIPPDGHRDGGRLPEQQPGRRLRVVAQLYEFHKLAYDELEAFDYEAFKRNGFEVERLGDYPLAGHDDRAAPTEARGWGGSTRRGLCPGAQRHQAKAAKAPVNAGQGRNSRPPCRPTGEPRPLTAQGFWVRYFAFPSCGPIKRCPRSTRSGRKRPQGQELPVPARRHRPRQAREGRSSRLGRAPALFGGNGKVGR